MMKTQFLLTFVLNMVAVAYSYSQNLPNIIPPSPSALQFQKYGDYPVSHFTGLPEIAIPLFTIKEGDLELPITLTYHASGIKPSDPDGIAGVGWTLNTGGLVSRTVMDKQDELSLWNYRYPFPNEEFVNNLINSPRLIPMTGGVIDSKTYLKYMANTYDKEPDLFSFNFLGNHGKFIFRNNDFSQGLLLDHKPLSIKGNKVSLQISSIQIVDQYGRTYLFGAKCTSSWYLSSMVSAIDASNKIDLSYKGTSEIPMKRMDTYTNDDWEPDISRGDCSTEYSMEQFSDCIDGCYSTSTGSTDYTSAEPTLITYRNGEVRFSYDPVTKMLSTIGLYNKSGQLQKKIEFIIVRRSHHLDFQRRPFLKEVKFYDGSDNFINKYTFKYIGENADIPTLTMTSIDYWGYRNGTLNHGLYQGNLIPPFGLIYYYFGSNQYKIVGQNARRTSISSMEIFTLNEIVYPTGGRTIFEYEANRFNGYGISEYYQQEVGGLRVQRISNYTEDNKLAERKEYKYGYGECGYGLMDIHPSLAYFAYSQRGHVLRAYLRYDSFRRVYIFSEPTVDITPHGSPVVYPQVTEYVLDEKGNNKGQTVYEYDYKPFDGYSCPTTNGREGDGGYPIYRPYQNLITARNDGKLIAESHYDNKGNPLSYVAYEYEETPLDTVKAFYVERYAFYISDPCPSSWDYSDPDRNYTTYGSSFAPWNYGDVLIVRSRKILKSVYKQDLLSKENPYGAIVENLTTFEYETLAHGMPTKETIQTSKGDALITILKYPHDFSGQQPYDDMVNTKHIWAPVIEQTTYKSNTDPNNLLQSAKTSYGFWNGSGWSQSRTDQILPQSVETKSLNKPEYEPRLQYRAYDGKGNILSVSKDADVYNSYFWSYNQTYPVVQAQNISQEDLATKVNTAATNAGLNTTTWISDPLAEKDKWQNFNSLLRNYCGPNVMITTYTYKPLVGMTSATDNNGVTTYYEYDSFGRLMYLRDEALNITKKFEYNYRKQ